MESVFVAFASFGSAPTKEMDNSHFSKMCKECGFVGKTFTTTDADMIFTKTKNKGERKISFSQFEKVALPEIAAKKKKTVEEIIEIMLKSAPKSSGTKADNVKLHDDKSAYTGVYKAGGPTNVDRDPKSLANVIDRRVSADIRGATG